ncbi:MAG: hypothetical protein K6E53_00425, partial [Lachnospiraceae bacterium]|nr:hypothetical protein [Lachnospiraceae bacterium]
MKNVIVIYDDSRKPDQEISMITGRKSYGNIIFKRQSLRTRIRERVLGLDGVYAFTDLSELNDSRDELKAVAAGVIRLYSDHEITDMEAFSVLLKKSLYVKENYAVVCDGNIAAILYPTLACVPDEADGMAEEYERIDSRAFTALSDVSNFRRFITSGFDARFFNALRGDEYTVIKSSENVDKLR